MAKQERDCNTGRTPYYRMSQNAPSPLERLNSRPDMLYRSPELPTIPIAADKPAIFDSVAIDVYCA
jgi:hypothetical protein